MSGKLLLLGTLSPVLISVTTGFALAVMMLPLAVVIVLAAIGSCGAILVHPVLVGWADDPAGTSGLRARAPLSYRVAVCTGLIFVAFFGTLIFFGPVALPAYIAFAALIALARFVAQSLDNGTHSPLLHPAPPEPPTREIEYGRRRDSDPREH